ncbi:MAG TPA: PadR family transcriptional regulator [Thermoanaerobaculia bacterium]|nr:PadR family transcriptional regulator [Thermoanaerobaculia bacterium]
MPRINKTWFAILGLLAWKPMSGYEIKKLIEIGLSYFWHESYGALYPTLDKLVAEGFATRRNAPRHGRRPRHVYSITAKGRRQVDAWLRRPADIPRSRNELQLKFFLSSRRPLGESIRLLEEYRAQQLEIREIYAESETILRRAVRERAMPDEIEQVLPGDAPKRTPTERRNEALVFLLTLRHGVRMVEARLDWCDEALTALRRAAKEGDRAS